MRRNIIKVLLIVINFSIATSILLGVNASSSPQKESKGERAWLLEPKIFNELSSAGKRGTLLLNNRLPIRRNSKYLSRMELLQQTGSDDNVRVNDPSIDKIERFQSESSIAINGQNVIVSFNDGGGIDFVNSQTILNLTGYAFSTDSGSTFTHKRIPLSAQGSNLGDGVVAFGPDGELYYAMLNVLNVDPRTEKSIIGVSKSMDNGATFSLPVDAATTAGNTRDFQDKEWLTVDKSSSSPFRGNVYVSWTTFTDRGSFISFSRSVDRGAKFEPPLTLSPRDGTFLVQGSMPITAPNGDLYVVYLDGHVRNGLSIVKSTDGGRTFSVPKNVTSFVNIGQVTGGGGVRTNSFPSIVIDKSGVLHIVFASAFSGLSIGSSLDRSDIFYVRSTDSGNTFTSPVKINDDSTSTTQLLPSIAVTGDGTLGVKWWDRRNDPANDSLTDVYMSISTNGGSSFSRNFRITNHNWVFGPSLGNYHGDYDDIKADGENFFLCWSDERGADPDVYFARVPISRNPLMPDFNISAKKTLEIMSAGDSIEVDLNTSINNNFSGTLALSVSPEISGLSFSFREVNAVAGQPIKLRITASSTVAPGTYLINVAAAGSNLKRSTSFRLSLFESNRKTSLPMNATNLRGFTSAQNSLQIDARGTIHLAFEDDTSIGRNINELFYAQSSDGGRTFSSPVKIETIRVDFSSSALALDSTGNIFIIWTFNFQTFFTRSIDGGKTFSAPIPAATGSDFNFNPAIAVDKDGNVMVAYIDFAGSEPVVMATRLGKGESRFSTAMRISQEGEEVLNFIDDSFIHLAFDSSNSVYVVYTDYSDLQRPKVKLAIAKNGKKFKKPKIIGNISVTPHIAIGRDDSIYVSFTDNTAVVVIKSTNKGKTFGLATIAFQDLDNLILYPFLIVDSRGNVSVTWSTINFDDPGPRNGNNNDVFLARSTNGGSTFGKPINLSANSGFSNRSSGFSDSNGNLFVLWTDDSTANTEAFMVMLPAAQ
jgi:hypothetical protein